MTEDLQLLREYAENRSEQAFAQLVTRHVNLVYSTALRLVHERQLAEEVTQTVFLKLAHKAGSLRHGTILSGWLYRTTQFMAGTARRSDLRRQKRENLAMQFTELEQNGESVWKEVAPLLEPAMAELRQADQDAVLLRFFAGKSLREVGVTLGISDDAAQKRVNRALDRMRDYFARRGVVVSAALLAPALAQCAVHAAPVSFVSTIAGSVVAGSTAGAGISTFNLFKAAVIAKLKAYGTVAIAASVLLFTGTAVVVKLLPETKQQVNAASANDLSTAAFVLRGTVRTPDGKPLARALVRVATVGGLVRLYQITNAVPSNARVSKVSTTTAADGTFTIGLPAIPPEGKAVIAVTDDAGYAVATADELSANANIVVQRWGRIEGVLRIGKSPGTNQMVNLGIWGTSETYEWNLVQHALSVRTDANGRFIFPRVAPGDIWLTRTVAVRPGDGRQSGHHYVKVAPGDHVQVQLGGTGRTLTGRMEWSLDEKLVFYGSMWAKDKHGMRAPPDWRNMSAGEKRKYVREWRESTEGELFKQEVRNYEFPVQPDGTFRVDDVLPGRYRMQVRADANMPRGQSPRLAASTEIQVNVPEIFPGESDEPIDLGTLYPKPVVRR